jgi:hypothetical protein
MTRMTRIKTVLAMLLLSAALPSIAGAGEGLPDKVREANARFRDVKQAVKEGYTPIPCTSGVDGGAMGIHYVNADLIKDEAIDVSKPEAIMYEPDVTGRMKLVAVEYITTKGPANLEGQLFSLTGAPNRYGLPAFYELHVWAWRKNPKGVFADMNPDVSCEHAHAEAEPAVRPARLASAAVSHAQ